MYIKNLYSCVYYCKLMKFVKFHIETEYEWNEYDLKFWMDDEIMKWWMNLESMNIDEKF